MTHALIEDTWEEGDSYDSSDAGIGFLRHIMESAKPSEIYCKDLKWVVGKYSLLSIIALGGKCLSQQFITSPDYLLLTRYCDALEKRLTELGIHFNEFPLGISDDKGWEIFNAMAD
ncbi:MAG: hypothetical protein UR66_C0009G0064 [Candidatus Moranbacteria bacterium GW2011_GWE1_35_17]|nr:MAG: hypothetical protein UR66_C0009G0064 [Candidatus Moranbacteria bacterium GW2011_GWE1_35_17]KKP83129.1 MAG: hypothetical protein UR82_C0024G0007 [Candidatus Moranbacteria bacterium GW2011_GWF1_35_5]KKP83995.1 MAG: hypothetical protein UR83_C0029G0028 [Candidatus Moranbacteria bacterium GW2011_GWF2_35_54]